MVSNDYLTKFIIELVVLGEVVGYLPSSFLSFCIAPL